MGKSTRIFIEFAIFILLSSSIVYGQSCPTIDKVSVYVNNKFAGQVNCAGGCSDLPVTNVKPGDSVSIKICCTNSANCPATLTLTPPDMITNGGMQTKSLPGKSHNKCVTFKFTITSTDSSERQADIGITNCNNCGQTTSCSFYSPSSAPSSNLKSINWLVGDMNQDNSVSMQEARDLCQYKDQGIVADALCSDANKNCQIGGIYTNWVIGDLNYDGKVSRNEVDTMQSLWRENCAILSLVVDTINNWKISEGK